MKIFITGASGLVGSRFSQAAHLAGHELIGTAGTTTTKVPGLDRQLQVDLRDLESVLQTIRDFTPDVIVNCAAVSEPAKCENDPETSFALNVALPESLARAAVFVGAKLIHLSSEQVFDGTRSPYRNSDPVSPINTYAQQKVESEKKVHSVASTQAVTLRAPLLMGNSLGTKRSLHERLLLDWSTNKTPKLFVDEYRQACTAENLAEAMLELCGRGDVNGIFHWAGAELLSRYDQGVRLREYFGLREDAAPLKAVARADDPVASSKRQATLGLILDPLAQILRIKPETFAEQMAKLKVPLWAQSWLDSART